VRTFAHEKNSRAVALADVVPGDTITMLGATDHILVITQVEYQNFIPTVLHYAHSIAWPSDGEYGHGVRTGTITIADIAKPLAEQIWEEAGKNGTGKNNPGNYTLKGATTSVTELRRLNWF
jgi:hypothetical protein